MSTVFSSPVIHGAHLGHSLGFPTINQIPPDSFSKLRRGVYFSRCTVDGTPFAAVSNLGVKPTVTECGLLVCETHILDFDRDLYGKTVQTELLCLRRPETRFSSIEQLSLALSADVRAAREYFKL